MKVYIATPLDTDKRISAIELAQNLRVHGIDVYAPWEHEIEHAWDYPNNEWGLMVFDEDVNAIKNADWVVVLSWGRTETTAGTAWEQGFAYGIGKRVLLVEMNDSIQSLMMANGRYATIPGITNAAQYLIDILEHPYEEIRKLRTHTEQK